MNVDVLQLHLSNLSHLLKAAGGSKTANELEEFCLSLQPYREMSLKVLVATIAKAEAVLCNQAPPRARKPSAPKRDPQAVANISNRAADLYHRAGEPGLTREEIESLFSELTLLDLPMKDLAAIALRLDISRTFTKKAKIIEAMQQVVLERKGALDRVNA